MKAETSALKFPCVSAVFRFHTAQQERKQKKRKKIYPCDCASACPYIWVVPRPFPW